MPFDRMPEYAIPESVGEDSAKWENTMANTVWRPRRVGEQTANVVFDQPRNGKTEFDFAGGVDCGRSPYPVLPSSRNNVGSG